MVAETTVDITDIVRIAQQCPHVTDINITPNPVDDVSDVTITLQDGAADLVITPTDGGGYAWKFWCGNDARIHWAWPRSNGSDTSIDSLAATIERHVI